MVRLPITHYGSRKRTLVYIGIGLAAVTASPFHQHKVGRANREVPYEHTLRKIPRQGPRSRFWTPQFDEEEAPVERHLSALEYLEDEPGHIFWSILADASVQQPRGASKVQRRDKHDLSVSRRRQQVTNKFVEGSNSAVLQEESTSSQTQTQAEQNTGGNDTTASSSSTNNNKNNGGSNNQNEPVAANDFVTPLHQNYAGFNVTAHVQYNVSNPKDYNGNTTGTSSTVLTSSQQDGNTSTVPLYKPMRIRAVLSEQRDGGQFLTMQAREVLLQDIIRPALLTWSTALRVEPVVGNLTVDEHQLYDSVSCGPGMDSGLPSPKVPSYHLKEGMPDTDMILYLSIGFHPDALNETQWIKNITQQFWPPANETFKNSKDNVTASPSVVQTPNYDYDGDGNRRDLQNMVWKEPDFPNQAPSGAPTTAANIPLAEPQFCTGDYVAAASYCSTDQYSRPTAALLHICIDQTFFLPENRDRQIVVIMHELGHALGLNSRSMAHFTRPDGSPITPRVDGEIVDTEIKCTGPSSSQRYANVTLPSEEILQFRTVRGGVRVAEIVTPSVLQVVRNHFDCQNLTGAELESGEAAPLAEDPREQACIGDHWERRLFRNDLMNPVLDSVQYSPFISTITLAYFADSGWYQVDLSMAELAGSWGRGAGCSFVEDACIEHDGQVSLTNKPFFCNAVPKTSSAGLIEEIDGCTADLSRKASCSLGQYDSELPPEYQYFALTYGATVGGSDPFIDYCPTYAGFANGLCSSHENAALLQVNQIERFGRRNSRCLSGMVQSRQTALCLPIACVVEDRTLHVQVGGTWQLCGYKDQELKISDTEYVVCPDPRRVCPTFFCQHDCLGTAGRCDYETGACVCKELNATAATEALGMVNQSLLTGICSETKVEQAQFKKDVSGAQDAPLMPHADSPLSDYYVPSKESLRTESRRRRRWRDNRPNLEPWQIVSVCIGFVFSVLMLLSILRVMRHSQESGNGGTGGNDSPPPDINPNKHKMIASVLVDMRIHGTDGGSIAPTADTASSLCPSDLESSASAPPSLGQPSFDDDDRSSLASEDVLANVDHFDRHRTFEVRKRRFKNLLRPQR